MMLEDLKVKPVQMEQSEYWGAWDLTLDGRFITDGINMVEVDPSFPVLHDWVECLRSLWALASQSQRKRECFTGWWNALTLGEREKVVYGQK